MTAAIVRTIQALFYIAVIHKNYATGKTTASPSKQPTTKVPTLTPSTRSPSNVPSVVPTKTPTNAPSKRPVPNPSTAPTTTPSCSPTLKPTLTALNPLAISYDNYTNTGSQHSTQVEPDNFGYNTTILSAVQTGRIYDGGCSNICYSTSTDSGLTWSPGCLQGMTVNAGGTYDAASDPSTAYCQKGNIWLISALVFSTSNSGIAVARSVDGGITFAPAVTVSNLTATYDKDWIVCDNTATSPHYGNCYITWDDYGQGNVDHMLTSTDCGR